MLIGAGFSDTGAIGIDFWRSITLTDAPSARFDHTAVWTGSLMLVWGGDPGNENTGGRYDPVTDSWTAMTTTGAPAGRSLHTAIWTGSLMLVWGGLGPGTAFDSGGRYDPARNSWTPITLTGAPSARYGHTAVWTGSHMLVWGGVDDFNQFQNTGGRYDPATDSWTPITITGAPSGRRQHTAAWTGSRMVVWGGSSGLGLENTGGQYDPATDAWTATTTDPIDLAPPGRSGHTAVWTGSLMIVWGGSEITGLTTRLSRYDPVTDSWLHSYAIGSPSPRANHTAVWTGSHMLVWGGSDPFATHTGGIYDPGTAPNTDTWGPLKLLGAPQERTGHTAVWIGSRMLVWGGGQGGGQINTGGQYSILNVFVKN